MSCRSAFDEPGRRIAAARKLDESESLVDRLGGDSTIRAVFAPRLALTIHTIQQENGRRHTTKVHPCCTCEPDAGFRTHGSYLFNFSQSIALYRRTHRGPGRELNHSAFCFGESDFHSNVAESPTTSVGVLQTAKPATLLKGPTSLHKEPYFSSQRRRAEPSGIRAARHRASQTLFKTRDARRLLSLTRKRS